MSLSLATALNNKVLSAFRSNSKLKNSTTIVFIVAILAAAFTALPNVFPKSLMEDNGLE